jgi:solute carrier family 35 protein E3
MTAERSTDRAPSLSSSITEAFDDEKNGANGSSDGFVDLKSPDEMEVGDDVERAELLPAEHEKAPEPKPDNSTKVAAAWMIVNTLATIGIVSL